VKAESFNDAQARAAWDHGADAWRAFIRSGADYYRLEVHGPALLEACGVVAGLRALDLGCGEGYFSRLLREAGADVIGLELSERMLDMARHEETLRPLGIDYRLGSAVALETLFAGERFDLITSCMAVQDMSDPGACLRGAGQLLERGGRLVFSVPHPCTDPPVRVWHRNEHGEKIALMIDRYFESGPAVFEWTMSRLAYPWSTPCWRHTLEQWSDLIRSAGLLMQRLIEPRPTEAAVKMRPELDDCRRVPCFLIIDAVKP